VKQNEVNDKLQLAKIERAFGRPLTTQPIKTRNDIENCYVIPMLTTILRDIPVDIWKLILQFLPSTVKMDITFPTEPVGMTFFGQNYGIHRFVTRCGYWHGNHRQCGHLEYDKNDRRQCWNTLAYQITETEFSGSTVIVFRAKNAKKRPTRDQWLHHKVVKIYPSVLEDKFTIDYLSRDIKPCKDVTGLGFFSQKVEFDDFDVPYL
jgi:hypothetical protein